MVLDGNNNVMIESDGMFEESESDQFCTEWASVGLTTPKLDIYPNPANNSLMIETPSTGGEFVICDAKGRTVYTKSNNELNTQINVSYWSEGMYIVTWTNSKGLRSVNQIGVIH